MYEYLINHIPEAIGIGSSAAAGGGFFLIRWFLRRRLRNRMLRKFGASDMRELAIEARNKRLRKDLTSAYRNIKKEIYRASTGGYGCSAVVSIWKWFRYYQKELSVTEARELFVGPLTRRLEGEGFAVEYLPAGVTGVTPARPSMKISWNAAVDDGLDEMVKEELNAPADAGKEGATW